MIKPKSFLQALSLAAAMLFLSCEQKPGYSGKDDQERKFIAENNIVSCTSYESDCGGMNEKKFSETRYNSAGETTERISYFTGNEIFSHTSQVYENGLLTERTYHRTANNPHMVVRYEYNEKGQQVKYIVFDSLDHRVSLHKVERKNSTEHISDYDAKGNLTDYRTVTYDSMEQPLVLGTRKIRYSYSPKGLKTEMAEVDTLSGFFKRTVYEYKDVLLTKQTIYYNDTCKSVLRYEYLKSSGEKW